MSFYPTSSTTQSTTTDQITSLSVDHKKKLLKEIKFNISSITEIGEIKRNRQVIKDQILQNSPEISTTAKKVLLLLSIKKYELLNDFKGTRYVEKLWKDKELYLDNAGKLCFSDTLAKNLTPNLVKNIFHNTPSSFLYDYTGCSSESLAKFQKDSFVMLFRCFVECPESLFSPGEEDLYPLLDASYEDCTHLFSHLWKLCVDGFPEEVLIKCIPTMALFSKKSLDTVFANIPLSEMEKKTINEKEFKKLILETAFIHCVTKNISLERSKAIEDLTKEIPKKLLIPACAHLSKESQEYFIEILTRISAETHLNDIIEILEDITSARSKYHLENAIILTKELSFPTMPPLVLLDLIDNLLNPGKNNFKNIDENTISTTIKIARSYIDSSFTFIEIADLISFLMTTPVNDHQAILDHASMLSTILGANTIGAIAKTLQKLLPALRKDITHYFRQHLLVEKKFLYRPTSGKSLSKVVLEQTVLYIVGINTPQEQHNAVFSILSPLLNKKHLPQIANALYEIPHESIIEIIDPLKVFIQSHMSDSEVVPFIKSIASIPSQERSQITALASMLFQNRDVSEKFLVFKALVEIPLKMRHNATKILQEFMDDSTYSSLHVYYLLTHCGKFIGKTLRFIAAQQEIENDSERHNAVINFVRDSVPFHRTSPNVFTFFEQLPCKASFDSLLMLLCDIDKFLTSFSLIREHEQFPLLESIKEIIYPEMATSELFYALEILVKHIPSEERGNFIDALKIICHDQKKFYIDCTAFALANLLPESRISIAHAIRKRCSEEKQPLCAMTPEQLDFFIYETAIYHKVLQNTKEEQKAQLIPKLNCILNNRNLADIIKDFNALSHEDIIEVIDPLITLLTQDVPDIEIPKLITSIKAIPSDERNQIIALAMNLSRSSVFGEKHVVLEVLTKMPLKTRSLVTEIAQNVLTNVLMDSLHTYSGQFIGNMLEFILSQIEIEDNSKRHNAVLGFFAANPPFDQLSYDAIMFFDQLPSETSFQSLSALIPIVRHFLARFFSIQKNEQLSFLKSSKELIHTKMTTPNVFILLAVLAKNYPGETKSIIDAIKIMCNDHPFSPIERIAALVADLPPESRITIAHAVHKRCSEEKHALCSMIPQDLGFFIYETAIHHKVLENTKEEQKAQLLSKLNHLLHGDLCSIANAFYKLPHEMIVQLVGSFIECHDQNTSDSELALLIKSIGAISDEESYQVIHLAATLFQKDTLEGHLIFEALVEMPFATRLTITEITRRTLDLINMPKASQWSSSGRFIGNMLRFIASQIELEDNLREHNAVIDFFIKNTTLSHGLSHDIITFFNQLPSNDPLESLPLLISTGHNFFVSMSSIQENEQLSLLESSKEVIHPEMTTFSIFSFLTELIKISPEERKSIIEAIKIMCGDQRNVLIHPIVSILAYVPTELRIIIAHAVQKRSSEEGCVLYKMDPQQLHSFIYETIIYQKVFQNTNEEQKAELIPKLNHILNNRNQETMIQIFYESYQEPIIHLIDPLTALLDRNVPDSEILSLIKSIEAIPNDQRGPIIQWAVHIFKNLKACSRHLVLDALRQIPPHILPLACKELCNFLRTLPPKNEYAGEFLSHVLKVSQLKSQQGSLAKGISYTIASLKETLQLKAYLEEDLIEQITTFFSFDDFPLADVVCVYRIFLTIPSEETKTFIDQINQLFENKTVSEKYALVYSLFPVPKQSRPLLVQLTQEILVETKYTGADIKSLVLFFNKISPQKAIPLIQEMKALFVEKGAASLQYLFTLFSENIFPIQPVILFYLLPEELRTEEQLVLLETDTDTRFKYQHQIKKCIQKKLTSTPPRMPWLASVVIHYKQTLSLQDNSPLLKIAQTIHREYSSPGNINPFSIYHRLLELAKTPTRFEPKVCTFDGKHMRINIAKFTEINQVALLRREDLPSSVTISRWKEYIQNFKTKVETDLLKAEQVFKELNTTWDVISETLYKDPLKTLSRLLKRTGPVSSTEAKWRKILECIFEKDNEPRQDSFFTEQEEMFIKTIMCIQNCSAGKETGIDFVYRGLDKKYHYPIQLHSPQTPEGVEELRKQTEIFSFLERFLKESDSNSLEDIHFQLIQEAKEDTQESSMLFSPLLLSHEFWDIDEVEGIYELNHKGAVRLLEEYAKNRIAPFVIEIVHEYIKQQFLQGTPILKALLGEQFGEEIHQLVYLENLIGPVVGTRQEIVFDLHTRILHRNWQGKTKDDVLGVFFEHVTIEALSKILSRKLHLDSIEQKFLLEILLNKKDPTDSLTHDDARKILQETGYIITL